VDSEAVFRVGSIVADAVADAGAAAGSAARGGAEVVEGFAAGDELPGPGLAVVGGVGKTLAPADSVHPTRKKTNSTSGRLSVHFLFSVRIISYSFRRCRL
jgi:hypothetical protein